MSRFCSFHGSVILPPSDMLVQEYLNAVIAKNAQSAINLAGGKYCRIFIEDKVKGDIKQYGSAEVRTIQTTIIPNPGSSDTIEGVNLGFEYRPNDQSGE